MQNCVLSLFDMIEMTIIQIHRFGVHGLLMWILDS